MLDRAAYLVVALALVAPSVVATHDAHTLPGTQGDEPVDAALDWLDTNDVAGEGHVNASGCMAVDDSCDRRWTKWVTVAAAHTGADPTTWPSPEAAIGDWVLDHADDLDDEELEECDKDCADERVFSLAKSILAIQASGHDPRSVDVPDGERDFVAELLDEHAGVEFGRAEQANEDIWALIALNAVDYDGPEVDDAIDRIEQAQNVDGGVRYSVDESPTVDVTGSAVMAMSPHDEEAFLDDARSYLESQQKDEGDHRACWPVSQSPAFSSDANAESTSRALVAVTALGEDPVDWSVDGQNPVECLQGFQAEDGGFRHSDGSQVDTMATYQSLTAVTWRPYGTADGPVDPIEATDQATVDEEHTVAIPNAQLRIGTQATAEHTWTPNETGTETFHGFDLDPVRPATVTVHVTDPGEDPETGGSGSSSGSDGGESDGPVDPVANVSAPARAERNTSLTVHVDGTGNEAPVTSFRVQFGDQERTDWQPTSEVRVVPATLGNHTVRAWAMDADGRISDPVETTVRVVDAKPRIEIDGPSRVNRSTPATFAANATDPDGPAASIAWSHSNETGASVEATLDEPGLHEVEATATDAAGQTAQASHEVRAINHAPSTPTVTPRSLEANATTPVLANASDPDGDELVFTWTHPDTEQPPSTGRQLHLDADLPGTHTVQVNATDPHGAWATARVTLTVEEAPAANGTARFVESATSSAPGATATSPETRDPEPATVELPASVHATANRSRLVHGTATSPSGAVVNVSVEMGGTLPVQGTDAFTAMVPALPPGAYELAARAADTHGWGPWNTTTLVVDAPPEPVPSNTSTGEPERSTPGPSVVATVLAAAAVGWRRRA